MRYLYFLLIAFCISGCNRTGSDVWHATKTKAKHIFGKDQEEEIIEVMEEDFIPLEESTLELAQSKFTPGEQKIPGIEGFTVPVGLDHIFRNIFFAYDDERVVGVSNQKTIANITAHMKKHPHLYIFVEGHCDENGSAEYNLALGTRRANSIRNTLIQAGVTKEQIFTISYGKERPCRPGHDENAWKENRRGEFKIYQPS